MRRLLPFVALVLVAALFGCGALPRPQPMSEPSKPVAAPTLPGFTRGLNIGNALDAPTLGAWGVTLDERHFRYAAEAGFDHIRLPVRFNAYALSQPPYTVDEDFLGKVDWALAQAGRYGLSIIVDFHHYGELMDQPATHRERFLAIWSQLAARYAAQPPTVALELLNEPNGKLEPALLNALMADALAIVRKSNPTRIVIVDSFFWAAAKELGALELPEDPNVVASFHMYQPFLFTHQGAEWAEPWAQTGGIVFPGPPERPVVPVPAAQREAWVAEWFAGYNTLPPEENPSGVTAVEQEFAYADAYVQRTGHRVYMGEFGVIDVADAKSRENWLSVVRSEAEARGIGWAYWDDGGRYRALELDRGDWDAGILRALLGKARP